MKFPKTYASGLIPLLYIGETTCITFHLWFPGSVRPAAEAIPYEFAVLPARRRITKSITEKFWKRETTLEFVQKAKRLIIEYWDIPK